MAFERRVSSRRSHTLMSELPLMLCSTQRPLLHSVCDPSLEFTNTSKCINSTERRVPCELANALERHCWGDNRSLPWQMPGTVIGGKRKSSVSARLYEKCCCFLTSHGTSYGKEKEHASALRLNDQRTWFKGSHDVPEHPLERVEGSRHTDELMGNLLVMVDSVWISMRVSVWGCSMTDKVWWACWSWFSHMACHSALPVNIHQSKG